jgi:glycosyltransferase involved in cell wall biosynthesis
VIPSRSEGFCVSALEALSCGLPVVATRAGGNPELIEDGVNGLLVESENPNALALALLRVLHDRDLRSRLAAGARPSIARFGLPGYVEMLAERYQEVIRARAASS